MDSRRGKAGHRVVTAAAMPALALLLAAALQIAAQEPVQEPEGAALEQRLEHQFDSLPPVVREAIRSAAPDMVVQHVESYLERDHRVYRARGRLLRELWYVTVRDDGRVLNVISDFVGN